MNDKKNVQITIMLDNKTELAFKKIIEKKGNTIQGTLETMIKDYIFNNLEYIITDNERTK